jgi:hypothetical protein
VWPYGGGAIAVGFVDPKFAPKLPSVPDDDPHRTTPPAWITDPDPTATGTMVITLDAPRSEPN